MDVPVFLGVAGAGVSVLAACWAIWADGRSKVGYLFVGAMFGCAVGAILSGLAQSSLSPWEARSYYELAMFSQCMASEAWLLFSVLYARGNASEFFSKWGNLWIGAVVLPAVLAAGWGRSFIAVLIDPLDGSAGMQLMTSGIVFEVLALLIILLTLINLEHTFRASVGMARWRVKYMIVGLGVLLGVQAFTLSQSLLYRAIKPFFATVNNAGLILSCGLVCRSLLRPGQWDVSAYPSTSVFRNSVTVLAAGAYLLIVGVLARIAAWLGGDASFEVKAFFILVSVVFVTVLALSDRARLQMRRWISHYLQKPLYDYRSVWRAFTEGIARHTDEDKLCQAVTKLTAQTFELLSVSLWLMDEKETLRCRASTVHAAGSLEKLRLAPGDAREVVSHFQRNNDPAAFEQQQALWAQALRQCHPAEFRTGGDRVCVPLVAGGLILGVILVGDRVGGVRFSLQDFDLLRCVGDQAAAAVLNSRLSKRLLQHKEMEAFQAMSTFFVHDLKNLASTLNLMLKNLPIHFDNPDFRADALRGIGKTCDHINHLISRLSLLRQGFQIRPVEADLNKVVAQSLSRCPPPAGVEIARDLRDLPKIMLDSEQIDKVITNLALNAMEALSRQGRISVETSQLNGWAVLTVSDTGCGMDPDFLAGSLFRPFQTTKKKGLGIGMFQSKMIVEAHGGRIEVESERGKGSTFRVLLPLPKSVA